MPKLMDMITTGRDESTPPSSLMDTSDDPNAKDKDSDSVSAPGSSYTGMSYLDDTSADRAEGPARPAYVDPVVAEQEERQVKRSRLVVIAVLIVSLAVLASTMYWIVSRGEHDTFEKQFENHAQEISSLVQQHAENTIKVVESFSATVSSFAEATNSSWPNVLVHDFPGRAHRLVEITNAVRMAISPVVNQEDRDSWFLFTQSRLPELYQKAIEFEKINTTVEALVNETIPFIFDTNRSGVFESAPGLTLPLWQSYPQVPLGISFVNYNRIDDPRLNAAFQSTYFTRLPTLDFARVLYRNATGDGWYAEMASQLVQPIFETMAPIDGELEPKHKVVAVMVIILNWISYFNDLLPSDVKGITLVLSSTCSEDGFTYQINGNEAVPLGLGDLHDTAYDSYGITNPFVQWDREADPQSTVTDGVCVTELQITLYPTKVFEEAFYTNSAIFYSLGVVFVFAFTSIIFFIYDISVRRRQDMVMARVIRQDKIVANMFPTAIRDRLYGDHGIMNKSSSDGLMLDDDDENREIFGSAALAELYPSVTVVFADIAGFTAWSSAREPAQVFALLEHIYSAFDKLAYRHSIFKVETVGDCYVAVCGLPEPREDHAVQVAKFARDCLHCMSTLTSKLEVRLGPDTGDLKLRVGIHSGQVTAGVLRGERSRFQLFGDTMNTAARMESTSSLSRIQVSSATAEELTKWKRQKWIKPRDGTISVKGKGNMQTYWLETRQESVQRSRLGKGAKHRRERMEMAVLQETDDDGDEETFDDEEDDGLDLDMDNDNGRVKSMTKTERLVEWNVEVLKKLLQQILAARSDYSLDKARAGIARLAKVEGQWRGGEEGDDKECCAITNVLDEFQEIITIPNMDSQDLLKRKDPDSIHIPTQVVVQLRDLLTLIASLYRPNPFHNFEHASHVTSSVRKLLTRIVKANDLQQLEDLAGHSYGITSDPITQFAVVFSAVIHDADHPGVPNTTLVQENTRLAQIYKKSIAEQNSVDLVWSLLVSPKYIDLRGCIYSNEEELRRFRQLVVNTVMATDIVDKELQALRKARWETAFSDSKLPDDLDMNRKATIVIEHLIQASDVSHTMQHWHIYKQWNERFFFELYGSYTSGRSSVDPSPGWYKGEIGFFDFYVIPLAKKLESCGCFGVSSDEYLSYAKANREEWVREGGTMVEEYIQKFNHTVVSLQEGSA